MCVRVAGNTQGGLLGGIGLLVSKDGGVGYRFNKAGSKSRSRDSEGNVSIPALAGERIASGQEVKLRDVASGGVAPAGDDEQGVNVAVGGAITSLETRFAHRAIRRDKPGDNVLCPVERCDSDQGVLRRAGSAHVRLRVARKTLIRVEARTEAVVRASLHNLGFGKPALPILEERRFVCC